jgi:hypothetical protein
MIRILRQLCPGLGLKETKDIVDQGGSLVTPLGYPGMSTPDFHDALNTLRSCDVLVIQHFGLDEQESVPGAKNSETISNIRAVAIAAIERGEYDIAVALIEVIQNNG